MSRLPDVIGVQLISEEVLELLRDQGPDCLHPDTKIVLAALMLADAEGVAVLRNRSLQRWCGRKPGEFASRGFIRSRIDYLVRAGLLAPGSSPGELRSMVARQAVVIEVEDAEDEREEAA
jgi:hypothetical protein